MQVNNHVHECQRIFNDAAILTNLHIYLRKIASERMKESEKHIYDRQSVWDLQPVFSMCPKLIKFPDYKTEKRVSEMFKLIRLVCV